MMVNRTGMIANKKQDFNINIKRMSKYEGSMEIRVSKEVPLLQYPAFDNIAFVRHGFSTRWGGVSEGIYSSMSFKEDGEDTDANIRENYRRMAVALGCDVKKMVRSKLCHGTKIHKVESEDFGIGVLAKSTLLDIDGLITNIPGVTLAATFADCVPLYMIDTKHKAVGLAHSGWRGTVDQIGLHMLQAMKEHYATEPDNLQIAIGPCICGDCYEVGQELHDAFVKKFSGEIESKTGIRFADICKELPVAAYMKQNSMDSKHSIKKYHLDLRLANLMTFLAAGVPIEQIEIADICTCCNPEMIFSHRFTSGKRGVSAAFLGIHE